MEETGLEQTDKAQRKIGAEAARAKRVDIAGTIAGKIAHDFNNLLTPMLAYPELIRMDLPEKCRGQDLLTIMEKTAQDMSHITQQLLALARKAQYQEEPFNINEIVGRVVALLRDEAQSHNIEINLDLANDVLSIKGTPEQMLRVVQNLCQNAIDAIETSGAITVRTENVYIDRPAGHFNNLRIGEYVKLTVSDTGEGISTDIKHKVFDPFFSTRRISKKRGSGLGLSIVHGIVGDFRGHIDFVSTPGKGTTFSLYFPISREDMCVEKRKQVKEKVVRSETVLIVDDDARQREIIAALFEQYGYRASCLPSGDKAVEYIAECAVPQGGQQNSVVNKFPDLMVLDVIMDPGMDGRETCKRILEIHPRQQIILVSGYLTPEDVGLAPSLGDVAYLDKPLTWQKIAHALRDLKQGKTITPAKRRGLVTTSSDKLVPCNTGLILIVDDEEGIRRLFHMLLSSAFPKVRIEQAGDGMEAVEAFKKAHHAVVLMDLQMPVKHGLTTFSEMQAFCGEQRWKMPAVVFCTGFAPPTAVTEIVNSGEDHCLLTKPVSGDKLVLTVRDSLLIRQ